MAQRSFGKDHPAPRLQIGADYNRQRPNCNAARGRGVPSADAAKGAVKTMGCGAAPGPLRERRHTLSSRSETSMPKRKSPRPAAPERRRRKIPARGHGRGGPLAHCRRAGAAGAAIGEAPPHFVRRRLHLAGGRLAPRPGHPRQPRRDGPAQGHRPRARHADGKYRAFRARLAGQQRAALGRARHGQVVAGQGRACGGQCRRLERTKARSS